MPLEPGLTHEITLIVAYEHTAAAMTEKTDFGPLAPVLSTPYLVNLMETTAHRATLPYLTEGQSGVGSTINIRHLAPTPIGMQVRIRAELQEVDGARLLFKVEAWDEVEKIAEGEHERYIIAWERFMQRVEKKMKKG